MAHDRVDGLALVIALFTFSYIFRGNPSFRKINVTCIPGENVSRQFAISKEGSINCPTFLFINSKHDHNFIFPNANKFLYTANTSSGELGQ